MGLIKAALELFSRFFKWLGDKQLVDAGKAAATGEQARETLDLAKDVHRPITDAERNSVWARLQAERAAQRRVPLDPEPRSGHR